LCSGARPIVRDAAAPEAQMEAMNNVSILGLGVMGSALASVLLDRGNEVTVWNRTAAKAEPLVRRGARRAASAAEAVLASPVVIVCVTNYEQTFALLDGADLRGRTLVQLSTGSPKDARSGEIWAKERAAEYLDGAILATPRQIGTPESVILASGSARAFAASRDPLAQLAGNVPYLGDSVAAASAFDQGFLSTLFGALVGFYHALNVVQVEGLSIGQFARLFEASGPAIIQMILHDAQSVESKRYDNPEASLETCQQSLQLMEQSAREAGLDASVPAFLADLFAAGKAAGLGAQSPASLVELLKSPANRAQRAG
jgi:3-hydroxyisobutyrate dehydrogenase-like beta-hydroxyacid dehydrogenase